MRTASRALVRKLLRTVGRLVATVPERRMIKARRAPRRYRYPVAGAAR